MLAGKMILPIVCQALVEISVFFLGDVIGITSPDWLGLVELLICKFVGKNPKSAVPDGKALSFARTQLYQ